MLSATGNYLRAIMKRDKRFIFGEEIPRLSEIAQDAGQVVSSDLTRATDLLSTDIVNVTLEVLSTVAPQLSFLKEAIELLQRD